MTERQQDQRDLVMEHAGATGITADDKLQVRLLMDSIEHPEKEDYQIERQSH